MVRVRMSNWMIVAVNVVTLAVAVSAMGFSLWFHVRDGSQCQRVLKAPLLVVGGALLVVAVAGLAGAVSGAVVVMWVYLLLLVGIMVGLVGFTIFTVMVTNKGLGQAISVADHRLGSYSKWLQKYVVNARNWDKIKSCMNDADMCRLLPPNDLNQLYTQITPIMWGCCNPPGYCGMERKKGSREWVMPKRGKAVDDPDCKAWSNEEEKMCFDCDSCKKAVLNNIRREWKMLALINIFIIILVLLVFSIACCALKNNRFHYYNNDNNKSTPN